MSEHAQGRPDPAQEAPPAADAAGAGGTGGIPTPGDPDVVDPGAVPDGAPAVGEPEVEPDWRDRYLRSAAELENVRKRARRDAAAGEVRGVARLARELLPALDNLDRALQHAEQAHAGAGEASADAVAESEQQLLAGLRLVHGELRSALGRVGIEAFDPTGDLFDPHQHEALSQQPATDGVVVGTVLVVYQQGYRLRDDVLRPAKVVVAG